MELQLHAVFPNSFVIEREGPQAGRFSSGRAESPRRLAKRLHACLAAHAALPCATASRPSPDICLNVGRMIWEILVILEWRVMKRRDRRSFACHVRQIAAYVCHVTLQMQHAEIAEGLGLDRSTVGHACHRVEDRRDDRDYDALVAAVERMACAAFGPKEAVAHG